jgi:hypothetical protein
VSNLPHVTVTGEFWDDGPPRFVSAHFASPLHTGDGRGVSRFSTSRGRAYELGQMQAGTASIEVDDPQETLNPANPTSPLNSGDRKLALYKAVGIRSWWPRTGNTLNAGTYGAGFHPGFEGGGVNGWSTLAGTITNVTTSPRSGSRCLRLALNGPTATAIMFANTSNEQVGPYTLFELPCTYSAWVRVDAANPGVSVSLTFGDTTSAATSSTTWARLSVTINPTQARTPLSLTVTGAAAGTGTAIVYLDDEQLEFDVDEPGPFTTTGPIRYPVFTGYIERYPQTWIDQGFRGVRPLECVDVLSVLSRTIIRESYASEVDEDVPSLYLPLDDEAGPGQVTGRLRGSVQLAEFLAQKGSAVQWQGDTLPDGTKAVVLSQQLQDTADVPLAEQNVELDTRNRVGFTSSVLAISTTGATFEFWVKVHSNVIRVALQGITSKNYTFPVDATDAAIGLQHIPGTERHRAYVRERGNIYSTPYGWDRVVDDRTAGFITDAQWHYLAISLLPHPDDPTKYGIAWRFDDLDWVGPPNATHTVFGINSIHIDATTNWGGQLSKLAVARMAFYPYDIGAERREAHYRRGIGYRGETVQERATRLLTKWWRGGFTVHPGAGLTLPADHGYTGSSLLAALEEIASTDEGLVYSSPAGPPVVESSDTRHRPEAFTGLVFGEDAAAGEFPYESLTFDYDPTYVYSTISLTRPGRSDPVELTDPVVEAQVGQRVFSKQLNVGTDYELEQAAIYYQRRYGQGRMRVQSMTLNPAANPELWPVVLGLDISKRVTIRRRPAYGPVISADYYVESVKHDVDKEKSTWLATFELSPAFIDGPGWIAGDPAHSVLGESTVPIY